MDNVIVGTGQAPAGSQPVVNQPPTGVDADPRGTAPDSAVELRPLDARDPWSQYDLRFVKMGVAERKEREFKRREQEILAAALKLSQSDQWQAVTIEQIAQAAEIGKGTVYKHFVTKDEIYATLSLGFHGRVVEALERLPEAKFERSVRAVVRVFWEHYRDGAEYQRVVQYCERGDFRRAVSRETRKQFEALDERFARITTSLMQAGIKQRLLPKKPLPLLLFGANAALYGGLHLAWGGRLEGRDSEKFLNELADFILRGWTQKKK